MKRFLACTVALALLLTGLAFHTSAEEKITLKVLMPGNAQSFFEGQDENNNDIHTYLEELTGYNLEYSILPFESPEQKMALIMSSGDLPDVLPIWDRPTYLNYIENGYLMALDEYIANSPLLAEDTKDPAILEMTVVNGIQYGIGMPTNGSLAPDALWGYIADVDTLGIDPYPLTLDKVTELFTAAKSAYPDKVTYAGAGADSSGGRLRGFGWLYSAFDLATNWEENDDGSLLYNPNSEKMRNFLGYVAGMSNNGWLDPEYAVIKTERLKEKIANNETVFGGLGWYDYPTYDLMSDENKNSYWEIYGAATGPNGEFGQTIGSPLSRFVSVPVTSKHPQEAVNLIAVLTLPEVYEFMFFGVKGVDYDYDDAGDRYMKEARRTAISGTQYYVYYYLHENMEQRTGRLITTAATEFAKNMSNLYGLTLKTKNDPALSMPYIEIVDEKAQDIVDLQSQYFLKIATGALGIDAFDQYLAEFDALGGKEYIDAVNAWYTNR